MGENRNFCFEYFARDNICLFFWREICKRILFNFLAEKVARGNSVQIAPNFPAKSLSIYTTAFSTHPFDKLIETPLTTKIFERK